MAPIAKKIRIGFVILVASTIAVSAQAPPKGEQLQPDDQARAVCDAILFVGGMNNGVSKTVWKRVLKFAEMQYFTHTEVHEVSLRIGKNTAPSRIFQITEGARTGGTWSWWVIPREDQVQAFLEFLQAEDAQARSRNAQGPLLEVQNGGTDALRKLITQSRHPGYTYAVTPTPVPILDPGTADPSAPAVYQTRNTGFFRGDPSDSELVTFKDTAYVQAYGSGREVVFRLQEDGELQALCWQPTLKSEIHTITNGD